MSNYFKKYHFIYLMLFGLLISYLYFSIGSSPKYWNKYTFYTFKENLQIDFKSTTTYIDNQRLALYHLLSGTKYTLVVKLDQNNIPSEIVRSIRVYSGSHEPMLGDPKRYNENFPKARLIDEMEPDQYGKTIFDLKPGRYFVFTVLDYESKRICKGFGVCYLPELKDVYLNSDKEFTLKLNIGI